MHALALAAGGSGSCAVVVVLVVLVVDVAPDAPGSVAVCSRSGSPPMKAAVLVPCAWSKP